VEAMGGGNLPDCNQVSEEKRGELVPQQAPNENEEAQPDPHQLKWSKKKDYQIYDEAMEGGRLSASRKGGRWGRVKSQQG